MGLRENWHLKPWKKPFLFKGETRCKFRSMFLWKTDPGWWFGCNFLNFPINIGNNLGFEHFLFSHILGIIIPIDELIFFRGVALAHQPGIHWLTGFISQEPMKPWPRSSSRDCSHFYATCPEAWPRLARSLADMRWYLLVICIGIVIFIILVIYL